MTGKRRSPVITIFDNVHSYPDATKSFLSLLEDLQSVQALQSVEDVTDNLKKNHTPAFALCSFSGDQALQSDIVDIVGLVLDFDKGHSSFDTVRNILDELGIKCFIHTTASHRSESPRLRAIIPYAEPLSGTEGIKLHKRSWDYFNKLLGPIDTAGKNPSQKWLFPKYGLEGKPFFSEYLEGTHRFNPLSYIPKENKSTEAKANKYRFSSLVSQNIDQRELVDLLEFIDPCSSYPEWFETIAASINAFGRSIDTIDTLKSWSQQCEDKYDEEAFHKAVESVRDDHENPAGIGKLRYLAGISPTAETSEEKIDRVTVADLEAIVPADRLTRATELTTEAHKYTMTLLGKYHNRPDQAHEKAIWAVCEGLAYTSFAEGPIRVAYPLPTGMGKTTSFRGFVHAIHQREEDISVLYCAERIEDLHELKKALIEIDGIPEHEVGLLHSSQAKYKDIPSIAASDAGDYRYLLLAHGRVQHTFSKPNGYLYYKDRKKDITVWDEAFYSTRGYAINADRVRGDIASWKRIFTDRLNEGRSPIGSIEPYTAMSDYLTQLRETLDTAVSTLSFTIPELDTNLYDHHKPLRTILGSSRSGTLENIIDNGGTTGKLIVARSNKSFISFDVIIPDEVSKVVVLDASAEINLLQRFDSSLRLGDIGDVEKDYSSVVVHYAPIKSSRDYLSKVFNGNPPSNPYLKELSHILKRYIPQSEDFIVFTYKDRGNVKYRSQILAHVDSLGLGYKNRCHVITWGNERGTNRYSHVKYAITLGVNYRDPSELAASIVGQNRDYSYSVDNQEIKKVSDSQQADILYQGLSRGNMRHVNQGKACHMTCWVFHKERDAIETLKQVMPNADFGPYEPAYLSQHGVSDAVADLARRIINYLNLLPKNIAKVSNRTIANDLGVSKTNSRKWQDAVKKASNDQYEWEKPKGSQSFLRREALKEYYDKKSQILTGRVNKSKTSVVV